MTGEHDFDFLTGDWRIHNRRLRERLRGSTEWESFEATGHTRPLAGGIGNLDEFVTDHWPGYVGIALRLLDRARRLWSIYWVSNRTGVLEPPVVGRFEGGVGLFEGPDQHEGQPVLVRFTWSGITATSARWEQAFSADGGASWETNWVMELTRIP